MTTKTIAPTLRRYLDSFPCEPVAHETWEKARRELRAILAVARAARLRVTGNRSWRDEVGIDRALSRLDRASGRNRSRSRANEPSGEREVTPLLSIARSAARPGGAPGGGTNSEESTNRG